MELTTDRIVAIIGGLIATGAISFGGLSSQDASTCRDLLQDERAACGNTLSQLAGQYSTAMDVVRDICRD